MTTGAFGRPWTHSWAVALLGYFVAAGLCSGAVVLDRIAVVVGKHVIKTSDIDHDLRLTAFLNREVLDLSGKAKRQAAERLIDQEIIRQEIVSGGYRRPEDSEAAALEKQLLDDRFSGSEARLRQALASYGLSDSQLRSQLLWQLAVLQFIDQRFRVGVYVTDEELHVYYDQHRSELQRQYPANSGFDALRDRIREQLEGERINDNFSAWLKEARERYHIQYKQEAFA